MKNNKKLKKEISFVKDRLGGAPELPEELSRDNIEAAVAGKKQKTPVKKTVKRVVSLTVAACVVLSVTFIYRSSVYAPVMNADAATYKEVGRLMKDYNMAQWSRNFMRNINNIGVKTATDNFYYTADGDMAIDESFSEAPAAAESSVSNKASSTSREEDHAQTNTREKNVFEDDIIQTDGRYIYILSNGVSFRVIDTSGDKMSLAAGLELIDADSTDGSDAYEDYYKDGATEEYAGFYLYGDYVVFVGTVYEFSDYVSTPKTSVKIYDLSDFNNISPVRQLLFDGSHVTSRITDGKMVVVTQFYPNVDKIDYGDFTTFIPAVYEDGEADYVPEEGLYIGTADTAESFTSVAIFDPGELGSKVERCSVFGGSSQVYCTSSTLYVYRNTYSYRQPFNGGTDAGYTQQTNIIAFDISSDAPAYKAKGCVPGYLLNTFSLDEYNGYLRVAATENSKNYVYVLDGGLNTVGQSEPLAQGEQIYGIRFSGDTAYMVTFYQTDPLFVIDLSDPAAPALRGELKLPGFSSYLHPVGDGMMLGIGRGGDENGTDGSAKISLFDVSDPYSPKETGRVIIPNAWFEEYYKAFVDMGDSSYLIPYYSWEENIIYSSDGDYIESYTEILSSGAIRVAVENGELKELGRYEIGEQDGTLPRATYIGDKVYVADDITWSTAIELYSFDRNTFEQLDFLTVPVEHGHMFRPYYYK